MLGVSACLALVRPWFLLGFLVLRRTKNDFGCCRRQFPAGLVQQIDLNRPELAPRALGAYCRQIFSGSERRAPGRPCIRRTRSSELTLPEVTLGGAAPTLHPRTGLQHVHKGKHVIFPTYSCQMEGEMKVHVPVEISVLVAKVTWNPKISPSCCSIPDPSRHALPEFMP
ncbi:hypothetical protein LZ31DRAFT_553235 [Colletotrichum somersetense]|nr:hypothetical protein LZ31DRAFT_553235 [Colletotrichum somersetense]